MVVASKNRWGDLLEDEEELPPSTTLGPDAKGMMTTVEYFRKEKGEVMKRVIKSRVVKIEKHVYDAAVERRKNWKKFGDAATERATDLISSQAMEEVPFERIRQKREEEKKPEYQISMAGTDNKAAAMSLRDMLYKKRMERQLAAAKGLYEVERPPDEDGGNLPPAGSKPGTWVPSSLRSRAAGGEGDAMQKRRDENSVRVTNLSEDVTEQDLFELFNPFGHVLRIFIAKDRETGESRGFAFVNFVHREDAQRAISRLDGYGYGHVIINVGWSEKRVER